MGSKAGMQPGGPDLQAQWRWITERDGPKCKTDGLPKTNEHMNKTDNDYITKRA